MHPQPKHFLLQPAKFRLDGGSMYGIIPKPLWEKLSPPDELNRIDLALRLWLIQDGERLILTDTGIGDSPNEKFSKRFDVRGPENPLERSLNEIGFRCENVTDLIISHLHFDHVGGLGRQGSPLFPNARLHLHKNHYEYAHNPTARDTGSFHSQVFDPLIDWYEQHNQIVWHQGLQGELIPLSDGPLMFRCSHGHTPFLMHPYNKDYIYLADLIPTAHHIHIPWVMAYDISPGETTKDKQNFLEFIQEKNLTLIFEHDVDSWGATIETDIKKGFKASQIFKAQERSAHLID